MKIKTLLLVALSLGALLLAQEVTKPADSIDKGTSSSIASKLASDILSTKLNSGSFTIVDQSASKTAMEISGISLIAIGDPSPFQYTRYARPKRADDVKVYLWTEDGKKFRAQWVEECHKEVTVCPSCNTILADCGCGHCQQGGTFRET